MRILRLVGMLGLVWWRLHSVGHIV